MSDKKPILYSRIIRSNETPKLVTLLIKNKVVRTETEALYFLLFVVALSSVLAVYFFMSLSTSLYRPAPSFLPQYPNPVLPSHS